ncbi:MAG: hypothetical protein RLZZ382_2060, partial [Bacteroidota bacterium]
KARFGGLFLWVINLYFEKIHLKELGNNLRLSLMYSG